MSLSDSQVAGPSTARSIFSMRPPIEIWDYVLRFLDDEAIEQLRFVDVYFNEVVRTASKRRLLLIDGGNIKSIIHNLERAYSKVFIRKIDVEDFGILHEILLKIGGNVTHFKFDQMMWQFRPHCGTKLTYFPKLERLDVHDCLVDEVPFEPEMFPKLKDLRLYTSISGKKFVGECLAQKQLFGKIKNLDRLYLSSHSETWNEAVKVMNNQKSLEVLSIDVRQFEHDFVISNAPNVKVRRLYVRGGNSVGNATVVALFFQNQGVECLSIEGFTGNSKGLDNCGALLSNSFSTITALSMSCHERSLMRGTVNPNVTDFAVHQMNDRGLNDLKSINHLFEVFPNMRNLSLPCAQNFYNHHPPPLTEEEIEMLQTNLDQLDSFNIAIQNQTVFEKISFFYKFLTGLHMYSMLLHRDWPQLALNCPKLRELHISNVFGRTTDSRFELIAENFTNLTTLIYTRCLTVRHLEIIRDKAKNLETFKTLLRKNEGFEEENLSEQFTLMKQHGIKVELIDTYFEEVFHSEHANRGPLRKIY